MIYHSPVLLKKLLIDIILFVYSRGIQTFSSHGFFVPLRYFGGFRIIIDEKTLVIWV